MRGSGRLKYPANLLMRQDKWIFSEQIVHPPIIGDETFAQAQQVLAAKNAPQVTRRRRTSPAPTCCRACSPGCRSSPSSLESFLNGLSEGARRAHHGIVAYQTGGAVVCPQCGSSADVRTIREFFDMTNAGGVQAFQRFIEQSGGPNAGGDKYNHYNVEGSKSRSRKGRSKKWERAKFAAELLSDPGGAAIDVALGFAGRAISRGAKKVVNEQVRPNMEAKAAQAKAAKAEQQFAQAQADQDAIVARYPELRECTKDQVVFLDGGSRTVPIGEIPVTVTLAQADALMARLR